MSKKKEAPPRQSKAQLAVGMLNQNRTICDQIITLRDTAESILYTEAPAKRQRKELLATAETLLSLQNTVGEQIPELVPKDCTKYSINCIIADSTHLIKTQSNVCAPRENMRVRTFLIGKQEYPLPENKVKFTAIEACNILKQVEDKGIISVKKAIMSMINYSSSPSTTTRSLIPCSYSVMSEYYRQFKINPDVCWSKKGRPPILDNANFLKRIYKFEADEGRAVGNADLDVMLKDEKKRKAVEKGNSSLIVVTPTKRSMYNYLSLIPQLDPARGVTENVQDKSEARYIAERSFRNAISHALSVSVAHYQVGQPDNRINKIDKATKGAQRLYKMIQKENNGADLKVVLPFLLSTTDDTTVFAFEGSVDGKSNTSYIINKDNDSGIRSNYTRNTSNTDSLRGIRIRHTFSFNAVGNTAPMYATAYGISEEDMPTATCPSGVLTIPIPGFCYGGSQDCANKSIGYLVFLRNTNKENTISTDQINHTKYRNEVFLPFVQST